MESRNLGLVLDNAGLCLLILSLTLHISGPLYAVLLGSSIALNLTGAAALFKFIAKEKMLTN